MTKRKMPRVGVSHNCEIKVHDELHESCVMEISGTGLSVITSNCMEIKSLSHGDIVHIKIPFYNDIEEDFIVFQAKVEWKELCMLGFSIIKIDKNNFRKWLILLHEAFSKDKEKRTK